MAERTDVAFYSGGGRCAAWLYRPERARACVVLAHGWTGVREQRLDAFAERFASAGLAALVFDYRHFGASGGEPRGLLDIHRQLADWRAAVAYARGLEDVNPALIGLWGSSFSGGHVIEVAAQDPQIAAVVAQVPFVDGLANLLRLGRRHALRLTLEGLRDQAGALAGRPPRMVASVGPPGSTAVMSSPDAEPGFRALSPPSLAWPNEAAARVTLRVGAYRPTRKIARIRCPILFVLADDDVITPPDLAAKGAARALRAEVRHYPGGHFDPYVGELFERVVADETEFLVRHLSGHARA
ncbi:MAG: alpha/beta hydrolase [Solirubrobacteraceae bacterium]